MSKGANRRVPNNAFLIKATSWANAQASSSIESGELFRYKLRLTSYRGAKTKKFHFSPAKTSIANFARNKTLVSPSPLFCRLLLGASKSLFIPPYRKKSPGFKVMLHPLLLDLRYLFHRILLEKVDRSFALAGSGDELPHLRW